MALARADLESLLRARKLDGTLAHVRPPAEERPALQISGIPAGDAPPAQISLPRGELSEIAGTRSTGRTTLMCAAIGSATSRGELAALVDALDRFDVASAHAAGVELANLLWVRGAACSVEAIRGVRLKADATSGAGHETLWRAVERAIKAFTLVLESRAFGLAVCDLADVPPGILRRLPFTTWFRLARLVEGGTTAALLVAPERTGRSAGGVTILLGDEALATGHITWHGHTDRSRLFAGIVPRARVLGGR